MDILALALCFLVVAFFYSSVGFGGGSSYSAILLLYLIPYENIPMLALTCNIIVVTGSSIRHLKYKNFNWSFLIPFLITSIPFAFIGGVIHIEKELFRLILGVCLLLASIKMIFNTKKDHNEFKFPSLSVSLFLGSLLGFISGLVGIGGGIFLSPILFHFKWGHAKQITAICSLFILFNSLSGLFGQLYKITNFNDYFKFWPLFLSVFIGGQLGSILSIKKLKARTIELLTAFLVLFVSIRVLFY